MHLQPLPPLFRLARKRVGVEDGLLLKRHGQGVG
jgi:hypothetical protein